MGFTGGAVEVNDCVKVVVAKIDTLSKENGSGEFWGVDGTTIPW
jgi:hypothetical protein